jgi:chromosome segregation ATPase
MSLTNQIAELEAQVGKLEAKLESEKRRNDMQAGALRESRAQNADLLKRNELLAARVATFEKHFFDFHGSAERIQKQKAELEPVGPMPTIADRPPTRLKLRDRLNGLVAAGGAA